METTGGVVGGGESHGYHITYGWENKLCLRMLQIPEKQESDKRKDSTSIHHFAAKLLKIIDFPIIFCNKSIIKVDDSLRAAKHPKQITEIIRRKLTFIFLRIFFYPTISPLVVSLSAQINLPTQRPQVIFPFRERNETKHFFTV